MASLVSLLVKALAALVCVVGALSPALAAHAEDQSGRSLLQYGGLYGGYGRYGYGGIGYGAGKKGSYAYGFGGKKVGGKKRVVIRTKKAPRIGKKGLGGYGRGYGGLGYGGLGYGLGYGY